MLKSEPYHFHRSAPEVSQRRLAVPDREKKMTVHCDIDAGLPVSVTALAHIGVFLKPIPTFFDIGRDYDPFALLKTRIKFLFFAFVAFITFFEKQFGLERQNGIDGDAHLESDFRTKHICARRQTVEHDDWRVFSAFFLAFSHPLYFFDRLSYLRFNVVFVFFE